MCAYKLGHPNVETLFVDFIANYEDGGYFRNMANYYLGQMYFAKRKYRDAIAAFKQVDTDYLSEAEYAEFYFEMAYSHFTSKKFSQAKKMFAKIINTYNQYYFDANYYYGILSFFDKDYDQALSSFQRIEKNKRYDKYMPYYITLIDYDQSQYDDLLAYAAPKAKVSGLKNQKEINHIVGQTLFNRKQFQEALPYLEFYVEKSRKVRKEDVFQLGFTQYQIGRYNDAIKNFTQLNTLTDSIGQNAMYHLADSYLKTNQKQEARNAFDLASRLDADKTITEVATFSYAKLSYELGYHSQAISTLRNFITDYPNSNYNTEARFLLSNIFETTQNYKDALELIESINDKTPQLLTTYQRIAYYRGVEFFNDHRYEEANRLFNKALKYDYDKNVVALCHFWKGDMAYRQKRYDESFASMEAFLSTSGGQNQTANASIANANYTMGYSLFKQKEYTDALPYFDKVAANLDGNAALLDNQTASSQLYPDAILRNGDCHFMLKQYAQALKQYDNIIKYKLTGSDYAFYQKGMLQGLLGEYGKKIDNLQLLIKKHPKSLYADDAYYQMALTQVAMEDYKAALETHRKLIDKYKESEYVRKSLVNSGLIHYNLGNHDKAIQYYEKVMRQFPKSAEAQEAVAGVRDVYVSKGDADGYASFVKKFPGLKFTTTAKDSLTYQIAENYYTKGDCENATKEFTKYLMDFKKGAFAIYAHYYRGQCLYSKQEYKKAGKDYDYIINEGANLFTEQALDKGARIALYVDKDYAKAYEYFTKLYEISSRKELIIESLRGLVKSSYYLGKTKDLDKYGKLLVENPDATPDDILDMHYYTAILAYKQDKYDKATQNFEQVAKKTTNLKGAQSRYYMAEILFIKKKYKDSKDMCYRVINETASQEYWVVKSFILLSDIFKIQNDIFQAKATLKSIIENYEPEDEVKKEARQKLAKLEQQEAANSKIKEDAGKDDYLEMQEE